MLYLFAMLGLASGAIVVGSEGDDDIVGTRDGDEIEGGEGDDFIRGQYGYNLLRGDLGEDTLQGGWGTDESRGGADDDELQGARNYDTLDGGQGREAIHGGDGDDRVTGGSGEDTLRGLDGGDVLMADELGQYEEGLQEATQSQLYAGDGNDTLVLSDNDAGYDSGLGANTYVVEHSSNNAGLITEEDPVYGSNAAHIPSFDVTEDVLSILRTGDRAADVSIEGDEDYDSGNNYGNDYFEVFVQDEEVAEVNLP
jgi:Ca2+-binding RTX toxin-like protein